MSALTTRQRDLLHRLLNSNTPLGASQLATQMELTPRQVNYGLKGLKQWLARRSIDLKITPGIGAEIECSTAQSQTLINELATNSRIQLVLTAAQRQQLLTLILLAAKEPYILFQLQQLTQVSRTTILKDLDVLADWTRPQGLELNRRPNFGIWFEGTEQTKRQVLAILLWGTTPLGPPITQVTHTDGLCFALGNDARLMPIVKRANEIIDRLKLSSLFGQVAYIEAQLGGRFTDDAVLYLAMVIAIQADRIRQEIIIEDREYKAEWFKSLTVWPIAVEIAKRVGWKHSASWPESEIANLAMHILATPRNERWPGDLEIDQVFTELIDELVSHISNAYHLPYLKQDRILRDGLVNHIIPACLRYRFQLWIPASQPDTSLSDKYIFEHDLANELAEIIHKHTRVALPKTEINNIALLLRAAYIRERPNQVQEVIVVCPSGMATAQLLIARLKARFPRLGHFEIVSLRQLGPKQINAAELIITTTPLPADNHNKGKVIQVHPLLLPEDVEAITQWLAKNKLSVYGND